MPGPAQTPLEKRDMEFRIRKLADEGNWDELERLLNLPNFKKLYDINAVGPMTGHSALHRAAKKGHVKVIELLLAHGADLILQTPGGDSAKDLAEQNKQKQAFLALRNAETKKFPPISEDEWYELLTSSDLNKFKDGLRKFNCNYYVGEIIEAVLAEDNDKLKKIKVRILIEEFGFNINNRAKSKANVTLLYELLRTVDPYKEIVLDLIKLTAGLNTNKKFNPNIKYAIDEGRTALMSAIAKNYQEIVAFLLSQRTSLNLDINAQDDKGYTALHYACIFRNIPAITLLMQIGAQSQLDKNGRTPQQLLHPKYQEELRSILQFILISEIRDKNAESDFLQTRNKRVILRITPEARQQLKSAPSNYNEEDFFPFYDSFLKKYRVPATEKMLKQCIEQPADFSSYDIKNGQIFFSRLTQEEQKHLSSLRFSGVGLKDHLLAQTEAAKQLFAPATANSKIAGLVTVVGMSKKRTVKFKEAAKETQQEQKTPH